MTPSLSGMTPESLQALAEQLGLKAFRGRQLFRQIHVRFEDDLDSMTDLPSALRDALLRAGHPVRALKVASSVESLDTTVKVALEAHDGERIETVLIPMGDGRFTQCMSTQAGCALACAFCFTGTLGLHRNLSAGEIVDQHLLVRRHFSDRPVRNIVFMGMGEPLLNYDELKQAITLLQSPMGLKMSPHRITVSTAGVVPGIERLGREMDVNLAVSLNAPNQNLRQRIMPVARRYPLDELMAALQTYPLQARQRITVEYVMLRGINDSAADAGQLVRLLSHLKCKVNLIPFNSYPGSVFKTPEPTAVNRFVQALADKHMTVTVRQSRGADIAAACGQLAGSQD